MMDRMIRNFHAAFAVPLTEREQQQAEYARYRNSLGNLEVPLSFDEWKRKRAERGNREGQNHD